MTMKNQLPFLRLGTALLYFFLLAVLTTPAWGARVKDIAALRGARDNELIGFDKNPSKAYPPQKTKSAYCSFLASLGFRE